jgi:uncharacterized BrkB/YihY/UPF0761 family membrane protein
MMPNMAEPGESLGTPHPLRGRRWRLAISIVLSLVCAALAFLALFAKTICDIDGCAKPTATREQFELAVVALVVSVVSLFLPGMPRPWAVAVVGAALCACAYIAFLLLGLPNHGTPG